MKLGLTLPNRAFDPYTPAELAALGDLKPSVLVMLLYGGAIDQTHRQQLLPFLGAYAPRVLLRPYAGNIPTWSPETWAKECFARINAVRVPGELIPANEMNLASEGGSEDWSQHIEWLRGFEQAWVFEDPKNQIPLHLPALSPTGNWTAGMLAYKDAGLDLLFDRIDCHAYGPDAATIAMATVSTLRGPCDVTEFNQIDPALFASQVEKGIESATWFLLGGTPDQAPYDILKSPKDYQSFKEWKNVPPTNAYDVGPGVLNLMTSKGDHPISDENYVNNAKGQTFKSETRGTKGVYTWWKADGRIEFVPLAAG